MYCAGVEEGLFVGLIATGAGGGGGAGGGAAGAATAAAVAGAAGVVAAAGWILVVLGAVDAAVVELD